MSGHTPGPWCARLKQTSFGNSGAWIIERDTDADVRTMVCEMPHSATSNPARPVADAHLIAAAPELLSALKDVTRILEAVRYTAGLGKKQAERLEHARAALKKAEGLS